MTKGRQVIILDNLQKLLSPARVEAYQVKSLNNNWFATYKEELAQAKEFYSYLHFLEVFLRNKINHELSSIFGDWLIPNKGNFNLDTKEQEKINEAILKLKKAKKSINHDNIISNLNFGFWTNLFHKSYNYHLWQQNNMIEKIFPHLKSHDRNINIIHNEIKAIRKLRNRVFHFENLQSWNLQEMRRLINKFIYGISGLNMGDILP